MYIFSTDTQYRYPGSEKACGLLPAETAAQSQQGFQDPLSAVVEENEKAATLPLDTPAGDHPLASRDCPTMGMDQHSTEAVDHDKNEATESSSAWIPEVRRSDIQTFLITGLFNCT